MAKVETKELEPVKEAKLPSAEIATRLGSAQIAIHRPKEIVVYDDVEAEDQQADDGNRPLGIIRVLQAGSPQTKERTGIGAKEGDFFNMSTNEFWSGLTGLFFIPVRQYLMYPEYIKRNDDGTGGGFLGIYEPEDPIVKKAQDERMRIHGDLRGPLPNGVDQDSGRPIELVETYYVDSICVLPDEEGRFPGEYGNMFEGSFAFSSSFIKPYNSWNDRKKRWTYPGPNLKPIVPKLYTHVLHIMTEPKVRGSQQWMIPRITLAAKNEKGAELPHEHSKLPKDSFLYQRAAELRRKLTEGAVQLDFSKDSRSDDDSGSTVADVGDTIGRGAASGEPAPWET